MRISQKEKMQLGYSRSPHSPSRDPNPSPRRSPDIDFSDVFGGPPRRASMQDMQTRYTSSSDGTWRGDGDGDGNDERLSRRSWSNNPIEKPVFGDEITTRRRYPSEDFFGDIFRGDQSQCSSPRITGRDPSSSSPGSRGLSPLPPGAVPLGSPAQFSLPARIASSRSSSTSMLRLSAQGVHSDVFQGGDAFSAYHRSPLAGEELKKDGNSDASRGGTQIPNGGNHFHFSIHKWASKGMPLVMSLGKRNSLRSKIQLERSLSSNDGVEVEGDTLVGEIQPAGVDNDEYLSFKVHVVSPARKESDQIVDKSVTDAPNSRPNNKVEDGNSISKEMKVMPEPDIDPKSDPKQSSNKLHGLEGRSDFDKNEGGEEVRKSKGENKRSNDNYPKSLGNDKPKEKIKESKLNDRVGEKGKGDKGKVKEFVKIFNQEPSLKPNADIDGKSPSNRRRNTEESRASSKSTLSSSKADGKMQGFDVNCRLDSSPKVDGNPTPSSGKQFEAENVPEPCHSSSIEIENLESTMASDGFRASSTSIDVAFESFVVEEIQEIQDKPSENSEDNEDVRAYESKILKWSKGKEGNIRALLSTLQYVLWPNSGWKPVPLVNIIEANAVKRSYQRALLYLHPDKLQQKGAAPHHKFIAAKVFDILQRLLRNAVKRSYQRALLYLHPDKLQQKGAAPHHKFIAAKVFDILQEAWDHFNTLGSL